MGVKLFELIPVTEIELSQLTGKIIVVDGNLSLYQFLSSIRQMDGTPLTDPNGDITSHLTGIFYRSVRLLQHGIKLCYVFDGEPPRLKQKERKKREETKKLAQQKYDEAKLSGSLEEMKKYASRTSRLTPKMVEESKRLISALGMPVVQAPSEGEAQAAFMVKNNDAYAVGTQDCDALLFGAPRVIKNLTINSKRKTSNKLSYVQINPELITLSKVLHSLSFNYDQLIVLGMLVGTDYNVGGIKGIGPKNGLKLIKKHGANFDALFKDVCWSDHFDYCWQDVFELFKHKKTSEDYSLDFQPINQCQVKKILVEDHGFSEPRVLHTLDNLNTAINEHQQQNLGRWL